MEPKPDEDGEDEESKCAATPDGCQDQINLLLCVQCAPNNAKYFTSANGTLPQLKICKKFADKVYKSCKKAEYVTEDGSCKQISELWDSSEKFWEEGPFSLQFDVSEEDDCFNAAGVLAPLAALVAAVAALF